MEKRPDARILLCHCGYAKIVPLQVKQAVLQKLKECRIACIEVPDLCELAAQRSPLLTELACAERLLIAACHPRAVQCLFVAGGASLRGENTEYLNMRESTAEQLLGIIEALTPATPGMEAAKREYPEQDPLSGSGTYPESSGTPAWKPWFPVIDYGRCQNCQQCLGFCLFSVYGLDNDGRVHVANPANCKTDCPACARVCPENAIIFPKYRRAPINGGELKEGAGDPEPVKIDLAALKSGDILKQLQERTRSGPRFSTEPGLALAMRERLMRLTESNPVTAPQSSGSAGMSTKKEPE